MYLSFSILNNSMKPLGTVKLILNGRITIPKEFREKYNWKEGDLLMLYSDDNKIIIEKLKQ